MQNKPKKTQGEIQKEKTEETQNNIVWQEKLLPSMRSMVIGLAIFFFIASLVQIIYLHTKIQTNPKVELEKSLGIMDSTVYAKGVPMEMKMKYTLWTTLLHTEASMIQNRYHQTNISLMSRMWTKYLGFVTGMILALVGAIFILGKVKESESKLDSMVSSIKMSITTASPGLLLAVLGTLLMLTTIITHHPITTIDTPQHLKLYPVILEIEQSSSELIVKQRDRNEVKKQLTRSSTKTQNQQSDNDK